MKKKIFKYIKVMMTSLLIASLTLPSYAAVSASDGSAFVTKAEFDAALSDFNARLTTFEAGINSKIDSQVSSYLDRNGIWNGKEQVNLLGITKKITDKDQLIGNNNAGAEVDKEIWNLDGEFSKSGLLYLSIRFQCVPATKSGSKCRNYARWSGSYIGWSTRYLYFYGMQGSNVFLNQTILNGQSPDGDATLILMFPKDQVFNILTFVSKETYSLGLRDYWFNGGSQNSTYYTNAGFTIDGGYLQLSISNAKVY